MKSGLLTKDAVFYAKDFRADLEFIARLDEKSFETITNWMKGLTKFSQAVDSDDLIEISRVTRLPIDDIAKALKPIIWLATTLAQEKANIDDVVADMVEERILDTPDLASRVRVLTTHFASLAAEREKLIPPRIPLKHIERIRTRCIFVSEFESSFDISKDTPGTYHPQLRSIHPAATLELTFRGGSDEKVGVLLNLEDLATLIKWLHLAEVELRAAAKIIPDKYLVIDKGAKQ